MRNRYVEYERSQIIGTTSIDKKAAEAARRWNQTIDSELGKLRKDWTSTPSNMTITLHEDAGVLPGGLVLSVPHEIGRVILHKRWGRILEHDVTVDAVIDGGIEDAFAAMEVGTTC